MGFLCSAAVTGSPLRTNERVGIRPDVELKANSPGIERAREALAVASQCKL